MLDNNKLIIINKNKLKKKKVNKKQELDEVKEDNKIEKLNLITEENSNNSIISEQENISNINQKEIDYDKNNEVNSIKEIDINDIRVDNLNENLEYEGSISMSNQTATIASPYSELTDSKS